jgi:tetratricopeptide (TPR) repeat protein
MLGDRHPDTLISINNTAALLWAQGLSAEAEPYYREALEAKREVLGDDHMSTLNSIVSLGELLNELERPDQALALLAPAEDPARRVYTGQRVDQRARLLIALGTARTRLGAHAEAEAPLLEAHDLVEPAPGAATDVARDSTRALVELYDAWDRAEPGEGHDADAAEWRARL